MRLITSENNDCLAASVAMVFNRRYDDVKKQFREIQPEEFPFRRPYAHLPKVLSMEQVCEWAAFRHLSLMPFPWNPMCSPHPDCPAVPVWDAYTVDVMFDRALTRGEGLLEGLVGEAEKGHMVAWDGNAKVVYDPRGYCYSLNVALDKFDFTPTRFWLAGRRA